MINDKERREVAEKLREAASAKGKRSGSMEMMLSKLLGIAKQDRGVFGQPVDVAATWRDVYRKLAELIDRPTCRINRGYRDTWGMCSNCHALVKSKMVVSNATEYLPTRHCPNCGAEVVSDED